jgi:hypothetical protein
VPVSSSTSSSDPAAPGAPPASRRAGFLGALAIVVAGEATLAAATVPSPGRHRADAVLTAVDRGLPNRDILFWADSVSARALEGTEAEAFVTDISSTQAISMAGVFFTIRRHFERSGTPRAVVLCVIPETLINDLRGRLAGTYFEEQFHSPREILEHHATTGRTAQCVRMAAMALAVPPSMRRQGGARSLFRRLRGNPEGLAPLGPDPAPLPEKADLLGERLARRTLGLSPVADAYLGKLAALCRERGARLILMEGPVPEPVRRHWERRGTREPQRAALRDLVERTGSALERRSWDPGTWALEEFYDHDHLLPSRMPAYGRRLAAELEAIRAEER